MIKKLQNTIKTKLPPCIVITGILVFWQIISGTGLIPKYMLPSPIGVIEAFIEEFPLLMSHMKVTLVEAAFGLLLGTLLGFLIAVWMDRFPRVYRGFYPIIVITQTIPTVAIAPLLVLWLGYGIAPKIVLIIIATFFPITVGLLDGFNSADKDAIQLLRSMGATKFQIFYQIKLPSSLSHFFASLKISASYSIVGAVISEWLGGFHGLGVYMTRVRKSYSFDKMFAVIFLISAVSLLLIKFVGYLKKRCMPWEEK